MMGCKSEDFVSSEHLHTLQWVLLLFVLSFETDMICISFLRTLMKSRGSTKNVSV